MARIIRRGFYKKVSKWNGRIREQQCSVTAFEVRGQNAIHIHKVFVDSDGLWTCSCRSNRFRGQCYHAEIVKTEVNRQALVKRLDTIRRPPAMVPPVEFDEYLLLDRFIAEPIHAWPVYLVISNRIYLDDKMRRDWYYAGIDRFAGTILEGAWQSYGHKERKFVVYDLLRWQGLDLTAFPLFQRLERLAEILPLLKLPIHMAEMAKDIAAKQDLLIRYGVVRLRDGAAPFIADGHSPRAVLHKKRKGDKRFGQTVTFEEATIPPE